ncbi:MAG: SdiA-regulated domain-containing protein [Chitinophagaceae bacterium]|nr:SdiA-regulated domain-containing protein [Chitinophagaceae bacterium]
MFIIRKNLHCFSNGKKFPVWFCVVMILLVSLSCQNQSAGNLSSPPGYDLTQPSVVKLPGYLDEISGIAYYPNDKSLFAINDEKGWLFKIQLMGSLAIQKWKYAKGADFEDLVLYDSTFYVLQSAGSIISFHFISSDSVIAKTYPSGLPGKNEFEILYLDSASNKLMMLCKDCERDDANSLSAFAFDITTHKFSQQPSYVIDVRKIETIMKQKKVKFKPSAAAINPQTGQLYIISSVNKLIVVGDKDGNPESVFRINPKLYKQPEGLTFTPEGHLLISNESADIGAANVLLFKYNKAQ